MNIIILVSICLAAIIKFSQQLPANQDERPDYNQCGETYQCFGMPDDCVGSLNCEVLLKTEAQDTGDVEFNLYWLRMANSTDSWVAAGISTDKDTPMNDASTAVFALDNKNDITVMLGLTHVDNNTGFTPMNTTGHTVEKKIYVNGLLRVQWRREEVTKVGNMTFDLKKTSYFVILARGPVKDSHFQKHTLEWASSKAYNLENEPQTQTPSKSTPTSTPTGSTGNSTHTETATWTTTTGNTTGTSNSTGTTSKTSLTSTSKPESTTQGKGSGSTISMSIVSAVFVSIVLLFN